MTVTVAITIETIGLLLSDGPVVITIATIGLPLSDGCYHYRDYRAFGE